MSRFRSVLSIPRDADTLAGTLVVLLSVGLIWCNLTLGHNWTDDFASYVAQSQSLVDGRVHEFVQINGWMVRESEGTIGAMVYPWGLPLLLAPVLALRGVDFFWLKLPGAGLFLLFLAVLWQVLAVDTDRWIRIGIFCMFAWNPFLIGFLNQVLSDVPFMVVTTAAVFYLGRIQGEAMLYRQAMLLGVMIWAAWFLREVGIVLLGVAVGTVVLRAIRSRGSFVGLFELRSVAGPVAVLSLSTAAAYLLTGAFLPRSLGSYIPYLLKDLSLSAVAGRAAYYLSVGGEFFHSFPSAAVVFGTTVPFAVRGVLRRGLNDVHVHLLFAAVLAVCLVFPFGQGLRYVFPLLPFYAAYVAVGMTSDVEGASGEARSWLWMQRAAIAVIAVGMLLVSASRGARNLERGRQEPDGPTTQLAGEMWQAVAAQASTKDRVVFWKPRSMYLFAGRKSIRLTDPARLMASDVVCTDTKAGRGLQIDGTVMERMVDEGQAELVWSNEEFRCYRMTGLDGANR